MPALANSDFGKVRESGAGGRAAPAHAARAAAHRLPRLCDDRVRAAVQGAWGKRPPLAAPTQARVTRAQDLKVGTGAQPKRGSKVSVDWDGYTIGYYGRVFQARNRAKGGAFSSEQDELLRWAVGSGACIPALDEAVLGMKVGGIRRIYVSPGPLFYPLGPNGAVTPAGRKLLPQPATFSGQRSLYFVLENQGLVDKSLLFDLELKRVDN